MELGHQIDGGIQVLAWLANAPCQRKASAFLVRSHKTRCPVPSPRRIHKARCAHTLSHTLQHPSTTQSHKILFTQHTGAQASVPVAKFTTTKRLVLNLDRSHLAASTNIEFHTIAIGRSQRALAIGRSLAWRSDDNTMLPAEEEELYRLQLYPDDDRL